MALRLPKLLPPLLLSELEKCVASETLSSFLAGLPSFLQHYFSAEDIVTVFSADPEQAQPDLVRVESRRADTSFSEHFAGKWVSSGVHEKVSLDLTNRLAPVSYSAFGWPYRAYIEDSNPACSVPREYTLLMPFGSRFLVTDREDPTFHGYLALLFDQFPEFSDEALQLIVSLPLLVSEIAAAYLRRAMR